MQLEKQIKFPQENVLPTSLVLNGCTSCIYLAQMGINHSSCDFMAGMPTLPEMQKTAKGSVKSGSKNCSLVSGIVH